MNNNMFWFRSTRSHNVSPSLINVHVLHLLPNPLNTLPSSNHLIKDSPNGIAEVTSKGCLEAVGAPGVLRELNMKFGCVAMFIIHVSFGW